MENMASECRRIVVALGGNAISAPGKIGTIDEQFEQVAQTAESLCDAIERGYHLVITHGNGPQVGNVLRRVEIATHELYPIPLEVCVADTQAGMGYMIAQCLANAMAPRNLTCDVAVIVTTVLVDVADPAFVRPTKAIGSVLNAIDAELHRTRDSWTIRDEGAGRFRRLVPSPIPRKIVEMPTISQLVESGKIVVCCGGGGIPVAVDQWGSVRGVAAVIDKDRTTGILARELNAHTLVILTSVPYACINFGKSDQQQLEQITADRAEQYLQAGHFGTGSMQPKMETAVDFVRRSPHADAKAIIAHVNQLGAALDGESGTQIVRA